jgi:HSP20 family protein
MKRSNVTRALITVGLLTLVGTVGAETYYTHQVAERVGANGNTPQTESQAPEANAGTQAYPGYGGWDPWAEMRQMHQRINQMFEESWKRMQADMDTLEPATVRSEPDLTLKDEKGSYVVTANLPGISEGDVNVSLDGRLLRISAQSQGQEQDKEDNGQIIRAESYASSIQRAFTLPGPVDASKMHTQFDDGVLTVTIPKATS